MLLKLFRTLRTGLQNFYRNGWLSIATISVIVVTLFIINLQLAITSANNFLLKDVQDRVSVSVYFNPEVSESDVMKVKDEIRSYPEVKSVEYISKEQALMEFKERNKENETIQKSLDEFGGNPLMATLNVKAVDPNQYEFIVKTIEESKYKNLIDKVNYHKYKTLINNLTLEAKSNQRVTIILGVTLSVVAILITFNSIRITMYAYRQEIEIMRLVGASNLYIRFPFVWEGILYGFFASLVVVPLMYLYLRFVTTDGSSNSVMPFSNTVYLKMYLTNFFNKHIFLIVLTQLGLGMFLGVVSSMIAIRKYLKV